MWFKTCFQFRCLDVTKHRPKQDSDPQQSIRSFMNHGRGGWCWLQPVCICSQAGWCCCHSAPLPCPQSHGSVRNEGRPRSPLLSAPARMACRTCSCWGSRSDAANRTCRQKSAGRGLPPPARLQGRKTVKGGFQVGRPGQRKAVCGKGHLWWLWFYLEKKRKKVSSSYATLWSS